MTAVSIWEGVTLEDIVALFGSPPAAGLNRKALNAYAVGMGVVLANHGWSGLLETRYKSTDQKVVAWVFEGKSLTPDGHTFLSLAMEFPRSRGPLTISRGRPPTLFPAHFSSEDRQAMEGKVMVWKSQRLAEHLLQTLNETHGSSKPRL